MDETYSGGPPGGRPSTAESFYFLWWALRRRCHEMARWADPEKGRTEAFAG